MAKLFHNDYFICPKYDINLLSSCTDHNVGVTHTHIQWLKKSKKRKAYVLFSAA